MVDINGLRAATGKPTDRVQIPLWSILTTGRKRLADCYVRSDSSMVDINCQGICHFVPPVGSDSSMVDINSSPVKAPSFHTMFRFLYGRY